MSNEFLMIMLAFAVSVALGMALQVRRLQKVAKELRHNSEYDMLSGLKNRNAFDRQITRLEGRSITVLVCDIDNLKLTNDTLGHWAGDELIRKTAEILKRVCPPTSQIFRMGGDEFLALLPCEKDERAERQIIASLEEAIISHNQTSENLKLSLSVGLAGTWDDEEAPFEIIRRADQAMYRQKHDSGASKAGYSR